MGVGAAIFSIACVGGDGSTTTVTTDAASDGAKTHPTSSTALVLTFTPETILPESDPSLDEMGYLRVQVFDTPSPPIGDATSALYEEVVPGDFQAGGQVSVSDLPALTAYVPDSTSTVFVRALFFDNPIPAPGRAGALNWGTWFGGVDVTNGFSQNAMLDAVPVVQGQTTAHAVPLLALRRVTVTVTTSATPVGDGEGALSVAASRDAMLAPRVSVYGYGIEPCVDLSTGAQTVDMQVVGSGTFFVAGYFDDLGIQTPGQMPPGTMLSVQDVDLAAGTGTFDQLTLAADQYSSVLSIDLGYVVPLPGDAGAPGPNSCLDLGFIGDGGP